MKILVRFGEWGELQLDLDEIASIEGLADQAGGHIRTKKDGTPLWVATRIGLKSGGSHVVPHTHAEVDDRIMDAIHSANQG